MVDRPLTEGEQLLVNEYNALERLIAQREKIVRRLSEQAARLGTNIDRRLKRYSIEFEFEPGDLQPQERSTFVDGGSRFYCHTVESSMRVVGEAAVSNGAGATVAGQTTTITLPYGPPLAQTRSSTRNLFFEYFWEIRDTGTDREWQDRPMPSVFMDSGALVPLYFPTPAQVPGGSEIFVNIDPFFSRDPSGSNLGLFQTVSKYILQVSFTGAEVVA